MLFEFHQKIILGSSKYVEYEKNNKKNPSFKFRPIGPWKRAKTLVKSGKNEMLFGIHQKFILGSIKYDKYRKKNEKNPPFIFRPVGSCERAKTWVKSGKSTKITYVLMYGKYGTISEKSIVIFAAR